MARLPASALLILLLLAPAAPGWAAADPFPVDALRLMEVRGNITIGTDGIVQGVELTTERVQQPLRDSLIGKAGVWRFRPLLVGGKPAVVTTPFRVTLAATPDGDQFSVRIDGVEFGDEDAKAFVRPDGMRGEIKLERLAPMKYPRDLQMRGRTGGVLLAILVKPDGAVEQVQAVQSLAHDIDGSAEDATARRTMKTLESDAVAAARRWRFEVPPDVAGLGTEERTVMVRVTYVLQYDVSQPGYWIPVKRGPRQSVAWLPAQRTAEMALGAGGASVPVAIDSPFHLLKPVAGTALD